MLTWFEKLLTKQPADRGSNKAALAAEEVKQLEQAKRMKPLTIQIQELMASLPPALRDRPWAMADLCARLQGKYRDHPHPQLVAQACRQLGWKQLRLYNNGYRGIRVWIPAEQIDATY
jgi:hypothetical protein